MRGVMFVSEEKLLHQYYIHPLRLIGWEGIWGLLLTGALLIPLNYLPCELDQFHFCQSKTWEQTADYFRILVEYPVVMVAVIVQVICVAFYNYFGVTVTKNVSSLARAIIDVTRTIFVWAFGLFVMQWEVYNNLQLIGFIILILGNLVYNEILKIPNVTNRWQSE